MSYADALALVGERKLRYHESNHSYYLGPDRLRSVTAIAKILADDYTLNLWRTRMVGRGLTIKRSLCEDIAAHWDDNDKQDEIVNLAIEIAGANDAASRGTQTHAATERFDLDQPIITDQQARDASVWKRTLDVYGLGVDPQWVERIVLYPRHLIAGRFDRIVWNRGRRVLLDVKTGWNAVKYPQATAVQLALYLNAPLVARDAVYDGKVEEVDAWDAMPDDLDHDLAYVLLMPTRDDGDDIGALFEFDMHEGTIAARHAIYARHFQMNNRLVKAVDPQPRINHDPHRLEALRTQIASLSDADRMALRARWDVATMGRLSENMTVAQMDLAAALLTEIDPFERRLALVTERFDMPDEGEPVDPETYGEIAARYHRLSVEAKNWIGQLALDASTAGIGFLPSEKSTRRRFNVLLGLIDLCVHSINDDSNTRAAALTALDTGARGDLTTGVLLGLLDADQASTFANWCLGLVQGRVIYDPTTDHLTLQPTEETHAHPSEPADHPQPETADHR